MGCMGEREPPNPGLITPSDFLLEFLMFSDFLKKQGMQISLDNIIISWENILILMRFNS